MSLRMKIFYATLLFPGRVLLQIHQWVSQIPPQKYIILKNEALFFPVDIVDEETFERGCANSEEMFAGEKDKVNNKFIFYSKWKWVENSKLTPSARASSDSVRRTTFACATPPTATRRRSWRGRPCFSWFSRRPRWSPPRSAMECRKGTINKLSRKACFVLTFY